MFEKTLAANAKKQLALLGKRDILTNSYLVGGTALALQLGHRISYDLDFFTPQEFDSKLVLQRLQEVGFILEQEAWGTLLGYIEDTKFSLFVYKYPLIDQTFQYQSIEIAGLKDLAAMKLAAISSRGTKRDFTDLYYLLNKFPLKEALKFYDQKFKNLRTNKVHILKSLDYFVDADNDPELNMLVNDCSWDDIKIFFRLQVKELTDELI